uniref:Uncharacterized protein n=1 Tax=Klebsiella pneumoniae TaxID=573 RepID=A0A8B0SY43_KLEPN|nr:hypothetical protein [Klebsiella pneumoniae]
MNQLRNPKTTSPKKSDYTQQEKYKKLILRSFWIPGRCNGYDSHYAD